MSKKEAAEKYFKLGVEKYDKKDYQGAIADYDKAIELNPKYADAYYKRGNAKHQLKQHKEAIFLLLLFYSFCFRLKLFLFSMLVISSFVRLYSW